MKKIVIIGCFFGNFRKDFDMWLNSCKYNSTIDWIIFSDREYKDKLPNNVRIIKTSLNELAQRIQQKMGFDIYLKQAYKLCDYKVAYGFIFEDFVKEYDFWGYCDFDMIFGDIRDFLSEEILTKYDKIYYQGHFSVYRNTKENNIRFMKEGENLYYKNVFQGPDIYVFDEQPGIYTFYKNNNWSMYINNDYADIVRQCKRFKIARDRLYPHKDYKKQTFLWNKGKLYHIYIDENKKIEKKEILYIHYSGRDYNAIKNKEAFFITNKGFLEYKNQEIDEKLINQMNPSVNSIIETIEFRINLYIFKIKRKIRKNKLRRQK